MRIIFDVLRDGLTAINTAADRMAAAREQVTTGRRINAAGDDPLAVQQAVGEHATIGTVDAYTRTRDSAAARLSAADSVLNGVLDKLSSGIVTATGARGPNIDAAARAAASQAIRGLRDSLLSDINTTFNGSYLFSGAQATSATYLNTGGTWTYQGDSASIQVEVEQGRLVSVSFDGQAIAKGSDAKDVFTALDDLAAAIDAGDNAKIGDGISALERAFDRANQAQGRLGADERGVDDATTRLTALRQAAETRRSHLEDANLAEAVTKMTTADTAYRAALGAVSSAERQSLLDYLR